eukprot:scaffold672_cov126-Cylindrotheca_fusiformis.AAC.52
MRIGYVLSACPMSKILGDVVCPCAVIVNLSPFSQPFSPKNKSPDLVRLQNEPLAPTTTWIVFIPAVLKPERSLDENAIVIENEQSLCC